MTTLKKNKNKLLKSHDEDSTCLCHLIVSLFRLVVSVVISRLLFVILPDRDSEESIFYIQLKYFFDLNVFFSCSIFYTYELM